MSSISILLVEPDRDARARTRALLEREGYTVLEAPDAPHALDIVRRREIALVITELYLTSTDEPCLVHAIRRSRVLHRTNVLAFTRHSTAADRAWALAEGADGYVLKKNGYPRLLEVVSHLGVPSRGRRSRMRRARTAQEG
jgi:CheY-like chemotaxis protein